MFGTEEPRKACLKFCQVLLEDEGTPACNIPYDRQILVRVSAVDIRVCKEWNSAMGQWFFRMGWAGAKNRVLRS